MKISDNLEKNHAIWKEKGCTAYEATQIFSQNFDSQPCALLCCACFVHSAGAHPGRSGSAKAEQKESVCQGEKNHHPDSQEPYPKGNLEIQQFKSC